MKQMDGKLAFIGLVPFLLTLSSKERKEPTKPNIIMVMCNQMRFDRLGAMFDVSVKIPLIIRPAIGQGVKGILKSWIIPLKNE